MENETNFKSNSRGRIFAGLIIICAGCLILAKQSGVQFPEWLFTWQMLLIVIGLFLGAKQSFRSGGWFVPLIIGSFFMMDEFTELSIGRMVLPIILIAAGVLMIFRPRRSCENNQWNKKKSDQDPYVNTSNPSEHLDSVSIFGGVKKNIISKNFKGGEITCIFGGAEINLSQADINGNVVLDVTQAFGGTKLIIPSTWEVKSEVIAILGGIEDKRMFNNVVPDSGKVLILKGTSIFGGIDIRSY